VLSGAEVKPDDNPSSGFFIGQNRRPNMSKPAVNFTIPKSVEEILAACPSFTIASTKKELYELAIRDAVNGVHEVAYDVPGRAAWWRPRCAGSKMASRPTTWNPTCVGATRTAW
jgi:hypothetical protein